MDRRLAALACAQSVRAVEGALAGCGERRDVGGSAKGKDSYGEDECMARGGREDGGEGAGSGSGEQEQEVVHGRKEAGAGGGQDAGAEGRREKEVQHEKEWETEREREEEARLYRRAAAITGESAASIGILSYFLFHRCAAITGESAAIGRCRCFVPLSLDVLLAALFLSFSLPYPDPPSLRRTPFVCKLVSTCSPSLTHARTRAHTHTLSLTHTHTH